MPRPRLTPRALWDRTARAVDARIELCSRSPRAQVASARHGCLPDPAISRSCGGRSPRPRRRRQHRPPNPASTYRAQEVPRGRRRHLRYQTDRQPSVRRLRRPHSRRQSRPSRPMSCVRQDSRCPRRPALPSPLPTWSPPRRLLGPRPLVRMRHRRPATPSRHQIPRLCGRIPHTYRSCPRRRPSSPGQTSRIRSFRARRRNTARHLRPHCHLRSPSISPPSRPMCRPLSRPARRPHPR